MIKQSHILIKDSSSKYQLTTRKLITEAKSAHLTNFDICKCIELPQNGIACKAKVPLVCPTHIIFTPVSIYDQPVHVIAPK